MRCLSSLPSALSVSVLLWTTCALADPPSAPSPAKGWELSESTTALLDVLAGDSDLCGSPTNTADADPCAQAAFDELVRRAPVAELVRQAKESSSVPATVWAVRILAALKRPDSERQIENLALGPPDVASFEATMHFARSCSHRHLARLRAQWGQYDVPSFAWAEAVGEFGRCKYYPATPELVRSINAASLNVVDAACTSLREMYPNGPDCSPDEESVAAWKHWLRSSTKRHK